MAIGEFHLSSHFASMQVVSSSPATPSLCLREAQPEKLYINDRRELNWGYHKL